MGRELRNLISASMYLDGAALEIGGLCAGGLFILIEVIPFTVHRGEDFKGSDASGQEKQILPALAVVIRRWKESHKNSHRSVRGNVSAGGQNTVFLWNEVLDDTSEPGANNKDCQQINKAPYVASALKLRKVKPVTSGHGAPRGTSGPHGGVCAEAITFV